MIDRDFPGETKIKDALRNIKGIGFTLSNALLYVFERKYDLQRDTELADIPEETMVKIQEDLRNIPQLGLPSYLFNRRKDLATGKDIHLISTDVDTVIKFDIEAKKDTWSWQGYRHAYGQKVRGQRTKNTGRTGRTVGVKKKKR